MEQIVCTKCGAEGTSKCPKCRSVFPKDQMATVMERMVSTKLYDTIHGGKLLSVSFTMLFDEDAPSEQIQEGFENNSRSTLENNKNWRFALCDHQWEYLPGVKCIFGCGYESPILTVNAVVSDTGGE